MQALARAMEAEGEDEDAPRLVWEERKMLLLGRGSKLRQARQEGKGTFRVISPTFSSILFWYC